MNTNTEGIQDSDMAMSCVSAEEQSSYMSWKGHDLGEMPT